MQFDSVRDILAGSKTGQTVHLRGWVHRQRTSGGKLAFIVLRDGTGTVQCTVKGGVVRAAREDEEGPLAQALRAKLEASVEILDGTVVADERAPGGFEVKVIDFRLHEPPGSDGRPVPVGDFPLRGEQGTEFELDKRHLWLRSTELSAILRVKGRLYKAIRDFYAAEGFVEVDPSVITTNACEGGSTLFTFDYFGQTAYLSQSAQMYLEGCIFGLPKVYSITPSFRAEKSRTNKHLTEFHHLEAEYAWWDAEDSRRFQEKMVVYLAHTVATECGPDLRLLGQDPERLLAVKAPFERIDYKDAIDLLNKKGFMLPYGEDFGVPHEKALTEGRTSPIFVCDWPAKIKAFYMAEKPGTDRVLCSDMLGPEGFGEIIGGSQRSEDVESMKRRLWAQWLRERVEATGLNVSDEQLARLQALPIQESMEPGEAAYRALSAADHELMMHLWIDHLPEGERLGQVWGKTVQFYSSASDNRGPQLKHEDCLQTLLFGSPATRWHADGQGAIAPYEWYFDLRRYGSVPHSGFGLGIERLLRWFTGQEHIRDMLPYPRTPSRAYP